MEPDGNNAQSSTLTARAGEQKVVSILATIAIVIGVPYLVIFVLIPFAFEVITGDFSNRWNASSEYSETWNALDDEGQRAFLRMDDSMRAKVASLPIGERSEKVRDWWLTEKTRCPYGEEPRVDGYKTCRSKRDYELGKQMFDNLMDRARQ